MKTGFHKTSTGNVLFGREFPEHLQVAYGRNIARLQLVPGAKFNIWLRDLPLSLVDLCFIGFETAHAAHAAEFASISKRLKKEALKCQNK